MAVKPRQLGSVLCILCAVVSVLIHFAFLFLNFGCAAADAAANVLEKKSPITDNTLIFSPLRGSRAYKFCVEEKPNQKCSSKLSHSFKNPKVANNKPPSKPVLKIFKNGPKTINNQRIFELFLPKIQNFYPALIYSAAC